VRTLPAYARSCRLTEGLELPELAWLPTAVGQDDHISFRSGPSVRPECPARPSSSSGDSHAIVYRDDESRQSR
jgi:hypothetical protein